jgi:hypothetical protein
MRVVVVTVAFLVTLLAGCSNAPSDDEAAPFVEPEAFEDLTVTESKGVIRGIVISETIVPIPDAQVELRLEGAKAQITDAQGAFVFTDLEPGDYFMTVSKAGYFTVQASTTVVAGVAEPPIVKVQLVIDALTQPFTELFHWAGFLECGMMYSSNTAPPPAGYLGFNACGLHDGRFIEHFTFGADRMPDFAQAEAVWKGTQPLSNRLAMGFYDSGTYDWKGISGESPLLLTTNKTEIYDYFEENQTELRMRMFPGMADEPASVVVTTNQGFDVYLTLFYGFTPRADWRFSVEGNCATPAQCS